MWEHLFHHAAIMPTLFLICLFGGFCALWVGLNICWCDCYCFPHFHFQHRHRMQLIKSTASVIFPKNFLWLWVYLSLPSNLPPVSKLQWPLTVCFITWFLLEKAFHGSLYWNNILAFAIHPALFCNDLWDETLIKFASGILPLSSFCRWASVRIKPMRKQLTYHKLPHVPCNLSLLQSPVQLSLFLL